MARHAPLFECPECGALLGAVAKHADWHARARAAQPAAAGDEFPTAKLPPIRDRILPRPPAPEVRELQGADLLAALAVELRAYEAAGSDAEDGTEDGPR